MTLQSEYIPLELEQLHREAAIMKMEGWRFIQTHAVNTDEGVDLYYSFMKAGRIVNYRVAGVQKDQPVPSITDLFLAAFVFENEARELFGIDMRNIAIDFAGAMYAPAVSEPMTIISPEQKAARDKALKAAAAQAAKQESASSEAAEAAPAAKRGFVMTPERRARLDAKLATMSPEKVAKVEAALKARAAEAGDAGDAKAEAPAPAEPAPKDEKPVEQATVAVEAKRDVALEEKLAAMDPEKAAKVRAALEGRGKAESAAPAAPAAAAEPIASEPAATPAAEAPASAPADKQIESLIALMDDEKALKVRAALGLKGGE